jgi:voltage-gated potassium channel Kch
MPHQTVTASAHDRSDRYDGVPVIELPKRAGAPDGEAIRGPELAKYVVVTGAAGYRAVFALAELAAAFSDRVILLADRATRRVTGECAAISGDCSGGEAARSLGPSGRIH